jgi:hypothetical protein
MQTNYLVIWEVEMEADTPRQAAQKALEVMRDPESIGTVFKVIAADGEHVVDLLEEEDCVTDEERSNGPKRR